MVAIEFAPSKLQKVAPSKVQVWSPVIYFCDVAALRNSNMSFGFGLCAPLGRGSGPMSLT